MKKKPPPGPRRFVSNSGPDNTMINWRDAHVRELPFFASSFHRAAKTLAENSQLDSGGLADFDACPVVFLYRHALELHLKALVLGEGGNYLATQPDRLSILKTRSVSWLAQFVCQIVTSLKWTKEFKCEGVESLADFKAAVEGLNSVDPGSYAFRYPVDIGGEGSVPGQQKFSVLKFAKKMDALLELLESTADALAATWDLQLEGLPLDAGLNDGSDFEPTVQ